VFFYQRLISDGCALLKHFGLFFIQIAKNLLTQNHLCCASFLPGEASLQISKDNLPVRRAWLIHLLVVGGDVRKNLPNYRFPNGKEPYGEIHRFGDVERKRAFLERFVKKLRLNLKEQGLAKVKKFFRDMHEHHGKFIPKGHPDRCYRGDIKCLVILHLREDTFRNRYFIGRVPADLPDCPLDKSDSIFFTVFLNVLDGHDVLHRKTNQVKVNRVLSLKPSLSLMRP